MGSEALPVPDDLLDEERLVLVRCLGRPGVVGLLTRSSSIQLLSDGKSMVVDVVSGDMIYIHGGCSICIG